MRKIVYQNHVLTLSIDEERSMAFAVWNGFLNSQEFQEAASVCIALIEEKAPTRWLADNRKMKAIRQADQQWFVETIIPRLLHSSLRRMATLVSEDLFNKMAVEQMLQRAGGIDHLAFCDFKDESEALLWLMAPSAVSTNPQSKDLK